VTIQTIALSPMTLSEAHDLVRKMRRAANDAAARGAGWRPLRLHAGVRQAEGQERADVDRHRADGN